MYGQSPPSRSGGGRRRGREVAQPPQQQQIPMTSNIFPHPSFFVPQQNPAFLPPLYPFVQNPTTFPQAQQPFPYSNFSYQTIPDNSNFQDPITDGSSNSKSPQQHEKKHGEMVEKFDKAAMRAWKDLLKLDDNISAWKVSQSALLKVKAESWESLGFQMQQVPSLKRLLAVEGKINMFIHCFVSARRITSLYDLEVAICESEGVGRFEELELGPLLRHPLVVHYFYLNSEITEVYRITTEEIISYLCEFIDTHKKKKIKADIFLDFISKKKSVSGRQKLSVCIQNFGAYVDHIERARQSEDRVLEKCYEKMKTKSDKKSKRPLFSSQKKELDDHFTAIAQRMESFSSVNTQFCGKHIRFTSSSDDNSSDDDDDSEANENADNWNQKNAESNCSLSLPNVRLDRGSGCPYPSATEEMTRLGLKNEVESSPYTPVGGIRSNADSEHPRRKRRCENTSSSASLAAKKCKKEIINEDPKNESSGHRGTGGHSLSIESLKMFFTTWKEACRVNTADEVLERMLQFYNAKWKKRAREMFKLYPFCGLLHAAVRGGEGGGLGRVNSLEITGLWPRKGMRGLLSLTLAAPNSSFLRPLFSGLSVFCHHQSPPSAFLLYLAVFLYCHPLTYAALYPPLALICSNFSKTLHFRFSSSAPDSVLLPSAPFFFTALFSFSSYLLCYTIRHFLFHNPRVNRKIDRSRDDGMMVYQVTFIKFGMSDHMYDTFQTLSQQDVDGKQTESSPDYISIDVEQAKKDVPVSAELLRTHKRDASAQDIAKKVSGYLENDIMCYRGTSLENKLRLFRTLCQCEDWLIEQYGVEKFESLGYGEYLIFVEKYLHLLPQALQKCIGGDTSENVSLEAHLLPVQLEVLLSQALDSLRENESINMRNVSELLAKQFPSVCFKLGNGDLKTNRPDILREKRLSLSSSSVLFSVPLSRLNCVCDSAARNGQKVEETSEFACNTTVEGVVAAFTTKDAVEAILKAPMMIDLNIWLHWDILYAPSLGSIVEWLLKEVNTKDLLCLITKDGKVIRIDHSATVDSFLKVLIRGSSFETAVQLLSLIVLYGGEHNVPQSLLKCYARQGFEVIIDNYLLLHSGKNPLVHGNPSSDQHTAGESTSRDVVSMSLNNRSILTRATPVVAKFVLECLSYLPIEFCRFAADVLITGLQSLVSNAPAAILSECNQIKQRLMLHEVGMSLGLMEWVQDYQSFCSSAGTGFSSELPSLDAANLELNKTSVVGQGELEKHLSSGGMLVSCDERVSVGADSAKLFECQAGSSEYQLPSNNLSGSDAVRVIESIRKEEFGIDSSLSAVENNMLEKQHARLGRALHCLSQELYSQDSHFLLELVQNADDNIYPKNVEPTLTFILREEGIIVLNNEEGFSAKNIRALCDVGNSTKKGHSAGYIGKKGIGFKSVFRVTDAPEIHSNGFHIKFDITEGQIGFVLPTVVPPCDINLFARLAATDDDHVDRNLWNTCIVLPFRPTMVEGFAMNHILSMFSDLHPSLLLFLHRLRCIKFRNLIDHSLIVMRRKVLGDGIVEVALGNEKMTWFVVSQKLRADAIRSDVQTTEISIAFTLQEKSDGGYAPILNQQPVFAFLPLRTYGLKFILQGDFVLPSSREEVDGNSPWNQWLLSEFPDLFVSAERSFCTLPCYRGSLGKAITVFMSFIPLVGEVHGFFSSLPRMIISKLRMSDCLILEGDEIEWAPPCKVLRNWTEQTRDLLPDSLLREHLGLGYLNKDIVLSDSLAKALGVEEYGPKILLGVISSLCCSDNGLKSVGISWLCSWLSAVYMMSSQFLMQTTPSVVSEFDWITNLQKTPFIPLSDGKYSSLDEGTIWLHSEPVNQDINDERLLKAFPKLYAKLRIVSPDLLGAASSCSDTTIKENVTKMLYKIGVQQLSVHDVVKVQIIPAISDEENATGQKELMIEYLAFAMFHLQSSCMTCSLERASIIAELHEKALILTNYGFKRSSEVPIHFCKEFENPVDMSRLITGMDMRWHEIDAAYVKHSITKSISGGVLKWRNFLKEIGITDFVKVVQVGKSIADMSLADTKDVVHVKDIIMSTDVIAKNWESEELFQLLSRLSSKHDKEKSKYLLEILDRLWDDYFSDKVTGYYIGFAGEHKPYKSSLLTILQDTPWVASNVDNKLYYPKDLFHDCVAVNSVLGGNAPYTIPKVRLVAVSVMLFKFQIVVLSFLVVSEKLLADIGFRTEVTVDDAISVLKLWRQSESPLKTSLLQMSNFYSFLWKATSSSKMQVLEELHSGPFIFVPNTLSSSEEAAVPGALLSPQEVYWHDSIGIVDQIKLVHPECARSIVSPQRIMLRSFYPNLHDFFVNECGVDESPSLCSYLQILLQLSTIALPHQAAKKVCEVFLLWDNALKSGSLSLEDVVYLKESLQEKKYAILPTRQDKWVSLHPSYGVVCWCDDNDLGREFRHLHSVEFLHFGESTEEEKQSLRSKFSAIMQRLGIPALSEIVTRESICSSPADSSSIFSLVNWVFPYAQRYIHNAYPEKYYELKQSSFENITRLKIVAVENLFFRNVIKKSGLKSKKRHQCSCLLQDTTLYCKRDSDPHSIFLELSHLLLDQAPNLQFANFLHMITTMAESGSTEDQIEFFILNSQKVPKIPNHELTWSLSPIDTKPSENVLDQQNPSEPMKPESINSTWPPAGWKTAPGFDSVRSKSKRTVVAASCWKNEGESITPEKNLEKSSSSPPGEILSIPVEVETLEIEQQAEITIPNVRINVHSNSGSGERGQGQVSALKQQAILTGRLGEHVAFEYFVGKLGEGAVNWVNENNETGLPYDIVVEGQGEDGKEKEYVEVKATKSNKKNWFLITMREWQFAVEKGESYSIAYVVLGDNNKMARVTVYKNPARLCQLGNLRLAVVVPKE
ncbi:histidine kinase [Striga asiatica]|uniref:Histidine kinase n=1 Tax=Striga asiatica TaxID=4170 RepID=A0A5A7Q8R5_STRAF|nr:histidine kinase [Striga asiatica]